MTKGVGRPKDSGKLDEQSIELAAEILERLDVRRPLSRIVGEMGPLIAALKDKGLTWKQVASLVEELERQRTNVRPAINHEELRQVYGSQKASIDMSMARKIIRMLNRGALIKAVGRMQALERSAIEETDQARREFEDAVRIEIERREESARAEAKRKSPKPEDLVAPEWELEPIGDQVDQQAESVMASLMDGAATLDASEPTEESKAESVELKPISKADLLRKRWAEKNAHSKVSKK